MNWSTFGRDFSIAIVIGAVLGLLVGLILVGLTDTVTNPFWSMSAGIGLGAVLTTARQALR